MTTVTDVIEDGERLAALRRGLLLDTSPSPALDRLTRLAARLLDAPVALVTVVDADRQIFKSSYGLPEPLASDGQTELRYSICQLVVATGEPLLVTDTHTDDRLRAHPAVLEYGVRAYAGVPLTTEGFRFGALCVLDWVPRQWTDAEMSTLADLAAITDREIALHVHERREAHRRRWQGISTP